MIGCNTCVVWLIYILTQDKYISLVLLKYVYLCSTLTKKRAKHNVSTMALVQPGASLP